VSLAVTALAPLADGRRSPLPRLLALMLMMPLSFSLS
jgi:hypothetical protein